MSMADLSATFPAAKGVLRDRYAELAIFDQQENQKAADAVLEGQRLRKQEIKAALDAQIRARLRQRTTDARAVGVLVGDALPHRDRVPDHDDAERARRLAPIARLRNFGWHTHVPILHFRHSPPSSSQTQR